MDGLVRGAEAIADYLNARLAGGPAFTKKAVYHLIETGQLRTFRSGKGPRGIVWAKQSDLDRFPEAAE